jgi:hypothetical protein
VLLLDTVGAETWESTRNTIGVEFSGRESMWGYGVVNRYSPIWKMVLGGERQFPS